MKALVAASILALAASTASRAGASVDAQVSLDDVRACAPMDDGTLWAATTGGVVKVRDGKVERVLTKLDGLLDGKTNALLVDGADLWIGSENGLIRAKSSDGAIASTAASPPVRAIVRREGATYAATFGGGVMRLDGDGKLVALPFSAAKGPSARVRATSLADFGGSIVAGTAGAGLYRLLDGKLVAVPLDGAKSISALGVHDGRLFLGALDGALSLGADFGPRVESSADLRAFASSGSSFLAASFGDGVWVEGKSGFVAASTPANETWSQAIGARGDVSCVGTPRGLFVKKGGAAWAHVATGGPPSNDVTAMARIGDRLFVGTYDRGVASFADGKWSKLAGVPVDARVDSMIFDGKSLWIGTTRGLVRVEGSTVVTLDVASGLPSNEVHAIASMGKGVVLVGTSKGAALVDGATITVLGKKQGLVVDAVWAVGRSSSGALIVGASTGLYLRAPGKKKWRRLSVTTGDLVDDWVTALTVQGDDVFVGTYAGGVSKLTMKGDVVTSSSLGGGSVNVGGLSIVGGKLWAATMEGLLVRALDAATWKNETKSALGVDVTGVIAAGDGVWIATRRGVTHVGG